MDNIREQEPLGDLAYAPVDKVGLFAQDTPQWSDVPERLCATAS